MESARTTKAATGRTRTRERILEVAAELFASNGYAGTSLADIAAVLGTTRGALFYHFPAKRDILDELMGTADAAFIELTNSGGTPHQLLRGMIDVYADSGHVTALLGDLSSVADHAARNDLEGMADDLARRLVPENPGRIDVIRGRAALAAVREATLQSMADEVPLSEETREQITRIGLQTLRADA